MTSDRKVGILFFGVMALWATFWGAIIWAVCHFVAKYW